MSYPYRLAGWKSSVIIRTSITRGTLLSWNRSGKPAKYRNEPVIADGIPFASKKEERRYQEIKLLLRAGVISSYLLQPKFTIQEKFTSRSGEKIREIQYIGDFALKYKDQDHWTVEDTKGFETKEFKLKKKMFLKRYPCIEFLVR